MSTPNVITSPGSRPGWVALGIVAGLALAVVLGPALAPRAARAVDDPSPTARSASAAPAP